MSCHSSGHTHEMHQVPDHCCHLWQTESHFSEVLCKGSAVKSWTFIGHHWLTVFLVSFVVSCVFYNYTINNIKNDNYFHSSQMDLLIVYEDLFDCSIPCMITKWNNQLLVE